VRILTEYLIFIVVLVKNFVHIQIDRVVDKCFL
ncbi:hypothetical protein TNCV_845521, partial [Trichonephila clavipes]